MRCAFVSNLLSMRWVSESVIFSGLDNVHIQNKIRVIVTF